MELESVFIFKKHTFNLQTGEAAFTYQLRRNGELFEFVEKLWLPITDIAKDIPEELLQLALNNLLLALGISYYKLYCPKQLEIEDISLSEDQAEFWNTVYTKGLGEFFYRNKIDYRGLIKFPFKEGKLSKDVAIAFPRMNRSLLGIGGGKDSIVAGELLKAHKKDFTSFVVDQHQIRDEVIALLGSSAIYVKREFDAKLFELNKREDSYNGHVPVSLYYAFIGMLMAILYDYSYIIVGNEQSANYGNVEYLGDMMNHQWSKSFEFEQLFQAYTARFITPDVIYFSLLRPLTELAIVERFVHFPKYFPVFSSCNRNFRITGEGATTRWCGECPKCAFAFLLLAAFLPKETVIGIFGEDLLGKKSLLPTYQELLGVRAIKPFDCVGTPDEVMVAFYLASKRKEYVDDIIMQFFEKEVLPDEEAIERLKVEVLTLRALPIRGSTRMKKEFGSMLNY